MKYSISYTANEKGRLRDPPLSPLGGAAVGMAADRVAPAAASLALDAQARPLTRAICWYDDLGYEDVVFAR
ncbi:hypothetical protein EFB14_17250 [Rhizobium fabae]|uniref:Uncharacterized protein n=1 Tax=Rhizobium fabae TaxID=573179 RepID=A0ABY0B8T4_9HYPH|nr:hypothetical protein EFB14_17250 [Rhizobium fabae]